jgi:hypothetical protein
VALTAFSRQLLVVAVGSLALGFERLLNAWWLAGIAEAEVHGRVVMGLAFAVLGALLATVVAMREDRNPRAR